ncbi:MAG: carbonic anhydrase [Acidobacteria bacterium]|nr:carbonic anhydrase [Acidobacteriota bacterium]MCA1639236.1 carbonic anhydrase [Acidobacteriota bacterium]
MSDNKIGRRDICKGFLALGGIALTGAAVKGQEAKPSPTPAPLDPILQDQRIADAVKRGATMEEISKLRDPVAANPQEAIRALKTGNARFFSGSARRPELSAAERRAQILAQTPFAVVLSCSDSRVPTEIIFDQGLGTLFITRVAGNVVETSTLGSIEYGVEHLKTYLVVVMGHEGCGAVKAALLSPAERSRESENVQALLNHIVPAVSSIAKIRDEKAKMREAVVANVRQQVQNLKRAKSIQNAVSRNKIAVIGAYYEITSGAVDFFETDEDLRLAGNYGERCGKWRSHLA